MKNKQNEPEIFDEDLSLNGYEVVRGEFFAHTFEPSFVFDNYKIRVNTACIRKLPETDYVQILVNPAEKKLAVRPCEESAKDSFRWVANSKKHSPKNISCKVFFAKIFSLMSWNPHYRYKVIGKLIRSCGELLFIFDLNTPEIFIQKVIKNGKLVTSRTPIYPKEWENQFGVPANEHDKLLQVNIFDGYTVFTIPNNQTKETEIPANDQPIETSANPEP